MKTSVLESACRYSFSAGDGERPARNAHPVACGILFCYNEEQVIAETIRYYLRQGIDLVVFDNCSTDCSLEKIKICQQENSAGRVLDIISVETDGFEWQKILKEACAYMHRRLSHYEWMLLIDADTFYVSPVKSMSLLEFMGQVKKKGFNIIAGKLYEFYPTEKDNLAETSVMARMRYYQPGLRWQQVAQQKIFLYHPSIDFYRSYGHICAREAPKVWESVKFLYQHYPWRSFEHGLKKVYHDRIPRYVERLRDKNLNLHHQYYALLPLKRDFVKRAADLKIFCERKAKISRLKFFWILAWMDSLPARYSRQVFGFLKKMRNSCWHFLIGSLWPRAPWLIRKYFVRYNQRKFLRQEKARSAFPHAFVPPREYHFLMNNFCNAACIFCNQIIPLKAKSEITLDLFKRMVAHIPVKDARIFYFSGGGEPFLCADLFPIVKFVNRTFPWIKVGIKTNGMLIGRYAEELAGINNCRLEISIHGREDINDRILQGKFTADIFRGLERLNGMLAKKGGAMEKVFNMTISRINIEEVPALIRQAAEFNVAHVNAYLCQYFPEKIGGQLKREDSLVFYKGLYRKMITQARRLARSLNVGFYAPDLSLNFFLRKRRECAVPWDLMLVDWEGNIYPCLGWEVLVHDKVKSGEYDFGNLLREDVLGLWNNPSWIRLRRTCLGMGEDSGLIPECADCLTCSRRMLEYL